MSNDNTTQMTISQQGNTTRMTMGLPAAAPTETPHEVARVHQGPIRFNMGHGEVNQSGVIKYTVGQDRDTSSVAATLQRVNGADTVELIPGNTASRTHIRQAIADGLIEPAGPGLWRDKQAATRSEVTASPAAAASEMAPKESLVDPGAGVFSPEEDALWAEDIEPLPQYAYDAAASSVTIAVLSGAETLDKAAMTLAELAAISPELASEYVEHGYAMHERIVAREVATMGIDDAQKPEFYSWLRNNKGRALQGAIQSLAMGRDITPFKTLALEFKRHH